MAYHCLYGTMNMRSTFSNTFYPYLSRVWHITVCMVQWTRGVFYVIHSTPICHVYGISLSEWYNGHDEYFLTD